MEDSAKSSRKSASVEKLKAMRAEHTMAAEVKKKVFEFEKRNRSRIVVFASTGGWYKIGGRSALFYYYDVAPRLGETPKLQSDRDFYSRFENGVISIRDLEKLSKKLSILGITMDKDHSSAKMIVYNLSKAYTEEDIARLQDVEQVKHEEYNKIIGLKDAWPKYYTILRQTFKRVYEFVRKSDTTMRDAVGVKMVDNMAEAIELYYKYTREDIDRVAFLSQSEYRIQLVIDGITMLTELQVAPLDFSIRLCKDLADAMASLRKEHAIARKSLMEAKQNKNKRVKKEEPKETYAMAAAHANKSNS